MLSLCVSNSYAAAPPPIIELIPSQSSIAVDEGQSFALTITVTNNGDTPFTPESVWYWPDYQSGDKYDALGVSDIDENSPIIAFPTLGPGESTWYKYTTSTVNDGASYTDGDGHWLISTNVSGTLLDGTPSGNPFVSSTLEIPVTVHDVAPTPEPGSYALMGVGGLLLALRLRKSGIASMFTA